MKVVLFLLAFPFLIGCSERHSAVGNTPDKSAWYWSWIEDDVAKGAQFHSEFSLGSGEVRSIDIPTDRRMEVGLVAREGYEIFKSGGSISLGTAEEPRKASGTPGVFQTLSPVSGMIRVRIENTSKFATRIAVRVKEVADNG